MSNDLERRPETGVIELVGGIITDVHTLIKQQLALFQHEIKKEIGHTREAGSLVAAGLAIGVVGSIFLVGMLVHLLAQMLPDLPLWICYGIVGAPVTILGGVLCLAGIHRFRHFNVPAVEPARELKE